MNDGKSAERSSDIMCSSSSISTSAVACAGPSFIPRAMQPGWGDVQYLLKVLPTILDVFVFMLQVLLELT